MKPRPLCGCQPEAFIVSLRERREPEDSIYAFARAECEWRRCAGSRLPTPACRSACSRPRHGPLFRCRLWTGSGLVGAAADPTRCAILARLALGETSVTELATPFEMSMPAVSQHLKVLERAGLIARPWFAKRSGLTASRSCHSRQARSIWGYYLHDTRAFHSRKPTSAYNLAGTAHVTSNQANGSETPSTKLPGI
jgi:DNA-binding transcriptional ArsR family regulator